MLPQLLLQLHQMTSQSVVLAFEGLSMPTRHCAPGNPISCLAFDVILETWRAASQSRIASYLPDLLELPD